MRRLDGCVSGAGGWLEAWSAAALTTDPVGSQQNPPVLRSPAGVFQDIRVYWQAGKPFYDPARIEVATLVIIAEWDRVTPDDGAMTLFHKLPNQPGKRFIELGEGTHLMMLEKNRMQLFREVHLFLEARVPEGGINLTPGRGKPSVCSSRRRG